MRNYGGKARFYSPTFGGRFLQTDPIGYAGGPNLYAYVGNDPVNFIDPLGLQSESDDEIVVWGWRMLASTAGIGGGGGGGTGGGGGGGGHHVAGHNSLPDYGDSNRNSRNGDGRRKSVTVTVIPAVEEGQLIVVTGERLSETKEAKVSKTLVNAYFFLHPNEKRNLISNLRLLLGKHFTDKQIENILNDVLKQDATTLRDLEALSTLGPNSKGGITLTKFQKGILDRFVRGLPPTSLNLNATRLYFSAIQSGRITVR